MPSQQSSFSVAAVPVARPVSRPKTRDLAVRGAPGFLAALAFGTVMGSHLADFGADDLRVRVLNANSDSSWSHVLIAAILVVATAFGVIGARRQLRQRKLWSISAAILALLSISELSSLHAKIDQMSWGKLVYAPILLALVSCLWRLSAGTRFRLLVRAGLGTLVLSFAIHVLGPHVVHVLGYGYDSWAYQIKVGLKQATELAGWLLVVLGAAGLIFTRPA